MQVDEPSPSQVHHELMDVEMRHSPHPELPAPAATKDSILVPAAHESIASSSKSEPQGQGVGRAMNTNAVKKVQKARQREARDKVNGELVLRGSVSVDEDEEDDQVGITCSTIAQRELT